MKDVKNSRKLLNEQLLAAEKQLKEQEKPKLKKKLILLLTGIIIFGILFMTGMVLMIIATSKAMSVIGVILMVISPICIIIWLIINGIEVSF